jgi:thiol-disulfide isomerase/thioredoxin
MIKSSLFFCLLVCFINISYAEGQAQKKSFIINGNIEHIKDSTLIELIDIESQECIASAYTKAGYFKLQGTVMSPTSCWLVNGAEYAILQVENTAMQFWSPKENMLGESKTLGGPEQFLQNQLNDLQRKAVQMGSTNAQNIYVEFGRSHSNSYLGLDIIYRNRQEIGRDTLEILYKNLPSKLRSTLQAKGLKTFLYERLAQVGQPYIDFQAKTFDGKNFKLSELKDKYIYLTFGAAGCTPCRMENKLIKANYDRLKGKIDFVNFSIDKTRKAWEYSTSIDAITWHNLINFKANNDDVKNLYVVQSIPTSFLIDKKGIIIKRFIGFHSDFLNIIEKIVE